MFFLFFIAIPLIEVILFITVGKYIGLWNTIFIIIITGVIGAILVKNQGISILNKALGEIRSNKVPIFSIFEGIAILIAGAFLLTPGFLTDTLGCVLLVPKARNIIINYIGNKIDLSEFMTWFIDKYPKSFEKMQTNPAYQNKFL